METNRPFLDFKAIKSRVAITDALGQYAVKLTRVNQTSLKGNCPLPSHSSQSKQTFYVNESKSVWYCHSDSCKKNGNRAGGNVIDFVSAMDSVSLYDAAKRLDELFPTGGASAAPVTAADAVSQTAAGAVSNSPMNKPLAFKLKDVNPEHPMIRERKISVKTAALFGMGFFPGKGSMAGRIVFELHENGNLIGYAGRTTLPVTDANPKWLFGKGLVKNFLYGLERCDPAKPVILVESLWGPPFFYEQGLQAASLMGSELTAEQERCLDPYPTIIIALDNDTTGRQKAVLIRERLKSKHHVLNAILTE